MAEAKTKFDYEVEAFETTFQSKRQKKIVLYGIGRMTATLVSRLEGFHIIGLLDRDESIAGKEIYGIKVMNREEAERNADLIIINTSETYWGTIYRRIRDWKVPIYFKNGERATEEFLHENKEDPYWKKCYKDLETKIQNYDIISFDIFDTLIMRKVYLPTDVFCIVEKELQNVSGEEFAFVEPRKRAGGLAGNATIDEIYDEIQKAEGWDDVLKENAKQCEIQIEVQSALPRRDMVKLYHEVKKVKTVYLISDMYLPGNVLQELLTQCGIEVSEDNIIVSCDYKKSKEEGDLWKYYADTLVKDAKALHIGDNEKTDGEMPQKYGIDSYVIWSADKMLQRSSIGDMAPEINTLFASVFAGILTARIFNSPFALHETCGKVAFESNKEAGYCLLGGVAYVFCKWLMDQVRENGITQLAFFSREGYLLTKLFEEYCRLSEKENMPEIIYLETSRRAVLTASIQDEKDILEVAEFPYTGKFADFLYDRFGISAAGENLQESEEVGINENNQKRQDLLKKYEKRILSEAGRERQNYLMYVNSLGITSDFAVVDSQLYGTTQYYLGKLLGKKLNGYYFCVCQDKTNKYLQQNNMSGCFPGREGLDGRDSNIYKNAAFIEAFFTAPYGMLECIEDNGKKRYTESKQNQINFEVRLEMLEGIQEFMADMMSLCKKYHVQMTREGISFMDKIFGIFMNNGFEPTEKMKKSFYYDNGIAGRKDMPIWE